MGFVPVIDLRLPASETSEAIDQACREIGFFQVVGHGLDGACEERAWQAARAFFELPLADKLAVSIPSVGAYGYAPFRAERLAASLGADTPPDLKETFSSGPPGPPPDDVVDAAHAFVYSTTPWPAALPTMEAAFDEYYGELALLAGRVMASMAVALSLPADHFEPFIDRHTSALRALHYPELGDVEAEAGQLRAGAHSDYGTLTLLRQDDAPGGLQVRDIGGEWHDVEAVAGAYVVNVGDALERWSNDRWRSTVHRVAVPPRDAARNCERQSMAFFHNANWDAVIESLPGCGDPGARPRYAPTTAGQHLMDKFHSTQQARPGG